MITALTVSYNTPEYLERLLMSFRKFYPDLPYLVIDGSDEAHYQPIKDFNKRFNVELIHFNYNIHHGPGMAYGIKHIQTDQILLIDSDVIVHSGGWIEMMEKELKKESYGIGDIQQECIPVTRTVGVAENRQTRRLRHRPKQRRVIEKTWFPYLHPVLALINKDVAMRYPMPEKGYGAPLALAMRQLFMEKKSHLIQRAEWLTEDLHKHLEKYVQHNEDHKGMGTVSTTGGYHYDDKVTETPIAIVITTFQRPDGRTPEYLNKTLYYVSNQTHQNYKIFVIGDCYTNEAELKEVVSGYKKAVCVNLPESKERNLYPFGDERLWSAGGVTAANYGIDMALKEGFKYICHLAHDDWWEINHLSSINRVLTTKNPLFVCTLSTYGGMTAFPRMAVTNEVKPYLPVPAGLIASSVCINYADTSLRVRDCFQEEKKVYPSDADLWARLSEEIKRTYKESYIVTTVTCHHDEEGYVMKIK